MAEIELDLRTEADIIDQIKELSRSYTPDWQFDAGQPDAGSALAIVYAEMLSKNILLFNRLAEKSKITFFNQLHAGLLPEKASEGYVTFHLVNAGVPGVEVDAGTKVIAEVKGGEVSKVSFETQEDVYVTPADIRHVFHVSDEHDYISHDYDSKEPENITVFHLNGQNKQAHKLYISHEAVFGISIEGEIRIRFCPDGLHNIHDEQAALFIDREKVTITYLSEEGFIPFEEQRSEQGTLVLKKAKHQPAPVKGTIQTGGNDVESCWICFDVHDITSFRAFSFEGIYIKSHGRAILPDVIYGADIQCNQTEFLPFGRKMGIYQEVDIASGEALAKKGALIHLKFKLDFEKTPLDTNSEKEIDWNWVMKSSDLEIDPEYDITIEEVIWEYYNGKGWNRIYTDDAYSDVFTTKNGLFNQFREIRFICPEDMSPLVLGSVESYYIRARILTMNNEFKMNGYYISPVMSETVFDFEYLADQISPHHIITDNNMEPALKKGNAVGEGRVLTPFIRTGTKYPSMYFGWEQAPVGGPIKILFTMQETRSVKSIPLKWEYYAKDRWKTINLVDETERFNKTGIVTMTGENDFTKKRMFGKELFWIRVSDEDRCFQSDLSGFSISRLPVITGIYINSVKAVATEGGAYTNISKGAIKKTEKSIGFINRVTNYEAFLGGCGQESVGYALDRNAALLKHQNRALTVNDFEELALFASHDIEKVRCFTGYNVHGKKQVGCVTLVVLQRSLEKGYVHFDSLKRSIMDYMKPRMSHTLAATNLFSVTEPQFIEIHANVSVVVKSFGDVFTIKRQISERLEQFLHPFTGGNDGGGWNIGEFPKLEQVRNVVFGIAGISFLKHISFSYDICQGANRTETDIEYIEKNRFVFPIPGKHQVYVSVET